jgi:hypothetical protein
MSARQALHVIKPLVSVVLAAALVLALAVLVANDALASRRCLDLRGQWDSGLLGGHCQVQGLAW